MTELYLKISKSGLEKFKKQAEEDAKANEDNDGYLFESVKWSVDNFEFEKDSETINIYGDLLVDGENFGYLSAELKIDSDMAIEIIECYMKKLGRLKTILEAAK